MPRLFPDTKIGADEFRYLSCNYDQRRLKATRTIRLTMWGLPVIVGEGRRQSDICKRRRTAAKLCGWYEDDGLAVRESDA